MADRKPSTKESQRGFGNDYRYQRGYQARRRVQRTKGRQRQTVQVQNYSGRGGKIKVSFRDFTNGVVCSAEYLTLNFNKNNTFFDKLLYFRFKWCKIGMRVLKKEGDVYDLTRTYVRNIFVYEGFRQVCFWNNQILEKGSLRMDTIISKKNDSLINEQKCPSQSVISDLLNIIEENKGACTIELMIKAFVYGEIHEKRRFRRTHKYI